MSTAATSALSAQELAMQSGKRVIHGIATDRVLRLYEAVRAYGARRVALDRAVLFTESFKETSVVDGPGSEQELP